MPRDTYNHHEVEKAAKVKWEKHSLAYTDVDATDKDPYYLLFEFPYPSGDLHTGHWYAYALNDILARYLRMKGKNVLFPIGFDAFGLPAENAAIKHGVNPATWTLENIERMRGQIKAIGTLVDWDKEIVSCSPEYYKWTQWLFLKLYEQRIAYRKEAPVKWCPRDMTVLANEQVINGCCERCDTPVEEKMLTQWFMKITDYADRLLTDLDDLPWREDIKEAQRQWIGKSEGALLTFPVYAGQDELIEEVSIFTTRADTVFGATYLVLAPDHSFVTKHLERITNRAEVFDYREATKKKTELDRTQQKEKTGVLLKGLYAFNPATKENIPVYIADYVLASYGTGAVMAVPAHDERDYEFAVKMSLPVKQVIEGAALPYTEFGILMNSEQFNGRQSKEALLEIIEFVGGETKTNFKMRDWLVSRQRYWGCPIPIVYDPDGKPHAVSPEHLPWTLPTDVDFSPTGVSPLATSKELAERVETLYGKGWKPECDTLDVFVDSSWYFTRYLDPRNDEMFSSAERMKRWLPVNRYSGGAEHTTVHVLYSRFFYKALYDLSLVPTHEPYRERFNRGLLLGSDGRKMSKRWGNIINPEEQVAKYGADTVRMYLAFLGPYNETGSYPWSDTGIESIRRFLDRVVTLGGRTKEVPPSKELSILLHKTIQKVSQDIEKYKYNTAISALMILLNALEKEPSKEVFESFLMLLSPFAPHLCEHLYAGDEPLLYKPFPIADEEVIASDEVVIVVQVSGKKKGDVSVPRNTPKEDILQQAILLPKVSEALHGRPPLRDIYVENRLINLIPAGDLPK